MCAALIPWPPAPVAVDRKISRVYKVDIRNLEHLSLSHPYRPASFYEHGGRREEGDRVVFVTAYPPIPRTDSRSAARKRGLEFFRRSGVRLGTAAERDGNMARLGRGVQGIGGFCVKEI